MKVIASHRLGKKTRSISKGLLYVITIFGMAVSIPSQATSLSINNNATGKSATSFLSGLDDKTEGFVRAFRRGSQIDFEALQLVVLMNQTANLENKLDKLISEQQKTNALLAKLGNSLIISPSKASPTTKG